MFTLFKPGKHTDVAAPGEEGHVRTTFHDQELPLSSRNGATPGIDEKIDYCVSRFSRYVGVGLFIAALVSVIYLIF